jgi:glycosyltransferase involved in cell wall biosynthesis
MHMDRKLCVAVECRIENPQQGVGTAVIALAKALSDSNIADQEYTFIVRDDMRGWLAPYIYGPCKLVGIPASRLSAVKAALRWIKPLRFIWGKFRRREPQIPVSDGYVESQKFDLVHFPTAAAYMTPLPTIYQPQDLQHLHYPQFFSEDVFASREKCYRAFCEQASYVCVQTEWTKRDVIKLYGLPPDKVIVIPWSSVFDAYTAQSTDTVLETAKKYDLPESFFFYPAVTWPHKNHEIIFRALDLLKTEHGIMPHVYFTGSSTERRAFLEKMARDLDIYKQVHFLGFLEPEELQAVFSAATAMVFPSRFEGFGLPILEAFHSRLPVLSSNATTLPEVAGDAALYFDPDSPSELAVLMKTILETSELQQDLIRKGSLILSKYSINEMAAAFQALYERTTILSSKISVSSPTTTT